MTPDEIKAYRKKLGLTQTEFGEAVGYSLRSIEDIEAGRQKIRKTFVLAVERMSLQWAYERRDLDLIVGQGTVNDAFGIWEVDHDSQINSLRLAPIE